MPPLALFAAALAWELSPVAAQWLGRALLGLWLFGLGASVGSFLNVVAYRTPRGLSLTYPPSRCPRCLHRIRPWHNLPVLGWLVLRGRCYDCRASISPRYPLVELLAGLIFLGVAAAEFLPAEGSLPVREGPPSAVSPAAQPPLEIRWGAYAGHVFLLSTLLAAALIERDGLTPPARLALPAILLAAAAPFVWPELRPVPLAPGAPGSGFAAALADGGGGLLVGAGLGWLGSLSLRRTSPCEAGRPTSGAPHSPALTGLALGAVVGLTLGWQAAAVVLAAGSVLRLLAVFAGTVIPAAGGLGWSAGLLAATAGLVSAWRPLAAAAPELLENVSPLTLAAAAVVTLAVSLLSWVAADPAAAPSADDSGPAPAPPSADPSAASESAPSSVQGPAMHPEQASANQARLLASPSYRLAQEDLAFLARDDMRPVRLQLELLKPELLLSEQQVASTIVVFGGTQILEPAQAQGRLDEARAALAAAPDDAALRRAAARAERVLANAPYYDAAREFARLVSSTCQVQGRCDYVVITGGGPGVMEAANRGAHDVGAKSIGLNITLPEEQRPNPYITPELCFQFRYFALRKMHFLLRAKALVAFPGGFGTLDEIFDALTLRQTNRMQAIPIILFGRAYWERVIDFQFLADEGVIRDEHLELISYAETPAEAWDIIARFHRHEEREP